MGSFTAWFRKLAHRPVPAQAVRRRSRASDERPLHAELYNLDQLRTHARDLAGGHKVTLGPGRDQLLPRLTDNAGALATAYATVLAAVGRPYRMPPAGDWLLDNYYLVEEQIRTARRHLPKRYSLELPRLVDGGHAGLPRVYALADELIAHVDGQLDPEGLSAFITAYQEVTTLTLGELWAVPIMLRLGLIENLRRVANRVADGLASRDLGDAWAERFLTTAENDPARLVLVLAELAESDPPLSSAFVAEFTRRLHGRNPAVGIAINWLAQRLEERNEGIESTVRSENQEQTTDQVSIGNSITSLRLLATTDWASFVESMSVVESTLRSDPAGVYPQLDFATRDSYRHVVEELAKRSRLNEPQVAQRAIALAKAAEHDGTASARAHHVGFFLLDKGHDQLELAVEARIGLGGLLAKVGRAAPLTWYLGAIAGLSALAAAAILAGAGPMPLWLWPLMAVLALTASSQWAIGMVNWLSTLVVRPHALPRIDLSGGIPDQLRTVVAVPTLLRRAEDVDALVEGLEVRFLANPDRNLHFVLLTDFGDAASETLPGDQALLDLAAKAIATLDERYRQFGGSRFLLLHRPRVWNPREGVWMAHERKRGKLAALDRLILTGDRSAFLLTVGETAAITGARYVITLDTDTLLPRDAARMLVGTIAHPLNQGAFDEELDRITDGYAILQPRPAIALPSATQSWFSRIFSGEPGIDPYSRAISDVYQDLFGEGSFCGKGIYDVALVERILHRRFPDDAILSHDLIEGCHARAGLVSDLMVIENHPARYLADVNRRHRWIRGDWQLLPWLLRRVPGADGRRRPNALTPLGWWKLKDNLRRSLAGPALLTLIALGLLFARGHGAWWVLVAGFLAFSQPLIAAAWSLLRKSTEVPLAMHLRNVSEATTNHLAQVGLGLVFLPFECAIAADAIVRTLWRLLVSRRHLLEWQTSTDAERAARADLIGVHRSMWSGLAVTAALAAALAALQPAHLAAAAPLLILWAAAPLLAWLISASDTRPQHRLDETQVGYLHHLARRIWRFFETYVSDEDRWLPPDNWQEYPVAVLAHRTSPTNIGLSLLANLSAQDFGWCSAHRMLDRCERTMATIAQMERHRGHLYNWYDTRSLAPLHPLYVSFVDSGNFVGHLLVLRQGLLEQIEAPIVHDQLGAGLGETLAALCAAANACSDEQGRLLAARAAILAHELPAPGIGVAATSAALDRIIPVATQLVADADALADAELRWWAGSFERECRDHRDHLGALAPWCRLLPVPEALWTLGGGQSQHLAALRDELERLDRNPTVEEVARLQQGVLPVLDWLLDEFGHATDPDARRVLTWVEQLRQPINDAADRAAALIRRCETLAERCAQFADVDFRFLYDKPRDLFTIGFNVGDNRLDRSYYDQLASEARLGSFVAIAQGQVRQDHWWVLGRLLTAQRQEPALLSWSGSMFEYLMPLLVMPTYPQTLLDQTYRAVIRRQIDYGHDRGVPWGISESGYNLTDAQLNYQYRAFGVPGLGLKRGLADDLVIAPYATVMALMVAPEEATANLQKLSALGHEGLYGHYEAIDHTPARTPRGQHGVTVRSFMAHHLGMSLLSLLYVLRNRPMQRRFCADPLFKATELLLQERVPKAMAMLFPHAAEVGAQRVGAGEQQATQRVFTNPTVSAPEVHLLTNGRYHVLVDHGGGGCSRWTHLAVNRWREDGVAGTYGSFVYLRDVDSGQVWSNAFQPTRELPRTYEAVFTQAKAEFRRSDHDIDCHTEIAVSPEDDIELRRITLANRSTAPRTIELTSFCELTLMHPQAEEAHPAFANLFVETRVDPAHQAILASRRPRKAGEARPFLLHLMTVAGHESSEPSYETDRARFLGRRRPAAKPLALDAEGALSGTSGAVLDPCAAIRRTLVLLPGERVVADLVWGVAKDEAQAMALVEKYHDRRLSDRVFGMAWTHSQVVLSQLGCSEADAQVFGRLAGAVIFPAAARRAASGVLTANRRGQSALWAYGISGDHPIVLLRVADGARMELVQQVLQAHAYWRAKGLTVDLVIWNEDASVYRQELHDQIVGRIGAGAAAGLIDRPGGIFVRNLDQVPDEDRVLMQAVARVVIADHGGTLAQFVERRGRPEVAIPALTATRTPRPPALPPLADPSGGLLLANGHGGFARDGREYVISDEPGRPTPQPWCNVIANPWFGTVIAESGPIYTWAENSHEFRITPWLNDAVTADAGEALYLRDEESGRFWSPTPAPARGQGRYLIRHGFGYTSFEHQDQGVATLVTMFCVHDAPAKIVRLVVRNRSNRARRLSATHYCELVLGDLKRRFGMHIITEHDRKSGAVFARNPYNTDFPGRIAVFDASETVRSITGDRAEFIGHGGGLDAPMAMTRARLSGKTGAGLDACAALQIGIDLTPDQEREVWFLVGSASSPDQAQALVTRFRAPGAVPRAFDAAKAHWLHLLGAVQIRTPDMSLDLLLNGWLLYQVMGSRFWGRTGFYQSGGAYGFRDQLQDSMAMVHACPDEVRAHLLRAAAHQFVEGDVQHWWHPPTGKGVRTHFSDDFLWLPLTACRYVEVTGDRAVLDEEVPFLTGRPVPDEDEGYYDLPIRADESATLYVHCMRAIERALGRLGAHGLPLMGCGDWNDGMNLVGAHGKGESVWLGFFLIRVLQTFAPLAASRGDTAFAGRCQREAQTLAERLDGEAWDGAWYLRAWFDDGRALGSKDSPECRIDALPQAWAVLSNATDPDRARAAMEAVDRHLVRRDAGLIQLFHPPFDRSDLDPGYIKGYVPGVRENGGQYTHAAVWTVLAFAALGDRKRAWDLARLINPLNHGGDAQDVARYQAEPYVAAADIYGCAPHTGRAGWTWYTGSAGWMYRLFLESLLGISRVGDRLRIAPLLPEEWPGVEVVWRHGASSYRIAITPARHAQRLRVLVDGIEQADASVPLIDDGQEHQVVAG